MTVMIRRLLPSEGSIFRDLRIEAMRNDELSFASSLAEEQAKPDAWFEDRVRSDGIFVAEVAGAAVGMVGMSPKTSAKEAHKGFIYSMFVAPAGRGRGVGTALMEAVLAYAAARVESVHLAVLSTNDTAIGVYERAGFERYGLEPRALKTGGVYTDDLLMWKRLK